MAVHDDVHHDLLGFIPCERRHREVRRRVSQSPGASPSRYPWTPLSVASKHVYKLYYLREYNLCSLFLFYGTLTGILAITLQFTT